MYTFEALAEIQGLPKTEHWYTGLARTLMTSADDGDRSIRRALSLYQKALELSANGWPALEGSSICYGLLQRYDLAVYSMKEAIANIPRNADYAGIAFRLRAKLGAWLLELDDDQETLETTQQASSESLAIEYSPETWAEHHILISVKHYLQAMYERGDYHGILDVLHELDLRRIKHPWCPTLWVLTLWVNYQSKQRDLDIFAMLASTTIALCHDEVVPLVRHSIAIFLNTTFLIVDRAAMIALVADGIEWLHVYAGQVDDQMNLYHSIQDMVQVQHACQRKGDERLDRDRAADILGLEYFNQAKDPSADVDRSDTAVAMLRKLAYCDHGDGSHIRDSYPALLFGRWLRECGAASEEDWKVYIRPSMIEQLSPLTHGDLYAPLGRSLLLAGDVLNAQIALGIAMMPLEEHNRRTAAQLHGSVIDGGTGSPTSGGAGEEEDAPRLMRESASTCNEIDDISSVSSDFAYRSLESSWHCHGCWRDDSGDVYEELYVCEICKDTTFCGKCLVALKDDYLHLTGCDKSHGHVQVFPIVEEARVICDALLEQNSSLADAWIEELRKERDVAISELADTGSTNDESDNEY